MIVFANKLCPFLFLTAYAFFMLGMLETAAGEDATILAPIPEMAAQQKSAKDVKEVYGSEIAAAKTPAAKSDVAKKMLQAGIDEKNDIAGRYALFILAKETAADAPDLTLAWRAVDETQRAFQIDGPRMKTDLSGVVAKTLRTPADRKIFIEQTGGLIQELLQRSRFDLAKQSGDLVLVAARSANDPQLVREATAQVQQIRDTESAYEEIKPSLATIGKSPSDPEANLKVGRFRCLVQGDWKTGLAMLALGSDATLKALADKEIAGTTKPEEQATLADGWWDVADNEKGTAKVHAQSHAAEWYQQAMPGLTGLARAKADKRLKDAAPTVLTVKSDDKTLPDSANKSVKLVTDLEAFKNVWIKGDKRGSLDFDPKTQTVTVESSWDLGGFDVPGPWQEISFNLAVEKLSFGNFDLNASGVVLKLGDVVKNVKSDKVRIVYNKSDGVVDAYIGDRKVKSGSVLDADFPKNLKVHFSSSGGGTASIHLRNIEYRPAAMVKAEGVPGAGIPSKTDGAKIGAVAPTSTLLVRNVMVAMDAKGKCVITLDSRSASDADKPEVAELGNQISLLNVTGAEVRKLQDGGFSCLYDFSRFKSVHEFAVVPDSDKSLILSDGSLVLHSLPVNNGQLFSQFGLPRTFLLPMNLKMAVRKYEAGSLAVQMKVISEDGKSAKFHIELTGGAGTDIQPGKVRLQVLTWDQDSSGHLVGERKTILNTEHQVGEKKSYDAMLPLRPEESLVTLAINCSGPDVAINDFEVDAGVAGQAGVRLDDRTGSAVVTDVLDGPAKKAGVIVGDEIIAVDGVKVTNSKACIRAIQRKQPGDEVVLTVRRGGNSRDFSLNAD